MPNYNDLRPAEDLKKRDFALVFPEMTVEEKKRTIEGLLRFHGLCMGTGDAWIMPLFHV